ncbi:hypothetical protein MMC17_003796 [Xylographa soralifera]|nr:hypothetical protein [Xylographa soralifera]
MFKSKPTPSHRRSQSTLYLDFPSATIPAYDFRNDPYVHNITLSAPPTALTACHPNSYVHTSDEVSHTSLQASEYPTTTFEASEQPLSTVTTPRVAEDEARQPKGLGLRSSLFHISKDTDFNGSPDHSPLPSPSKDRRSFLPSIRGDYSSEIKPEGKKTTLANWFEGESAPISLGVPLSPVKEKSEYICDHETNPPSDIERQMFSTPARPSALSTSRFSFFSTKFTSPAVPQISDHHDEFSDLDIKASLLPRGQADPFSPSSFKNLLQTAEGLLSRMQAAYKQRVLSLQEITAEKEAQSEELEEAHTRAKHLKLQLDDMTAKMVEQDTVIMSLVDDLAEQKQWRNGEEAKKSIRLVGANDNACSQCHHQRRPKKRNSTATTVSDSGFESESDEESIFSQLQSPQSPAMSSISSPSMVLPDAYVDQSLSRNGSQRLPSSNSTQRDGRLRDEKHGKHNNALQLDCARAAACPRCAGVQPSEAWGVAEMMKMENTMLKERVEQLEGSLDGCLDLVRGLGI